ncbi:MAG: hypothetical protein JXQ65_13460 [Candidatus Marinimicrobia bacterium]|nr:hypothetical protein [Candidatus Neomarinimicrobiota bacterium]
MNHSDEFLMFALGIGVFIFLFAYKKLLDRIPYKKYLILAFSITLTAWMATVLETFFLNNFLNLLEHFSYTFSTLVFFFWTWKISTRKPGDPA